MPSLEITKESFKITWGSSIPILFISGGLACFSDAFWEMVLQELFPSDGNDNIQIIAGCIFIAIGIIWVAVKFLIIMLPAIRLNNDKKILERFDLSNYKIKNFYDWLINDDTYITSYEICHANLVNDLQQPNNQFQTKKIKLLVREFIDSEKALLEFISNHFSIIGKVGSHSRYALLPEWNLDRFSTNVPTAKEQIKYQEKKQELLGLIKPSINNFDELVLFLTSKGIQI